MLERPWVGFIPDQAGGGRGSSAGSVMCSHSQPQVIKTNRPCKSCSLFLLLSIYLCFVGDCQIPEFHGLERSLCSKRWEKNPVHPFQFSSVSFFFLFFCLLRNPNKQKFNMENSVSMAIYLNILGCKWQQFNCFMSSWGWQLEGWRTNPNPSKSLVSPQSWFKNCLWSVLKALQVLGPCRSWWWLRQW